MKPNGDHAAADAASPWARPIFDALMAADVRQVTYVPDAGHARLIDLCRAARGVKSIVLTTEEEGIAVAAGAWLGGERAVLLMQSSGVGNCINMAADRQLPAAVPDRRHHARRVGGIQSVAGTCRPRHAPGFRPHGGRG